MTESSKQSGAARGVSDEQRSLIEQALPERAPAQPAKARKLLIFDRTVGGGGHPSIPHANLAFARMGEKTGAFEAVVEHEPEAFARGHLEQYDAVFFNNTLGNLFEDADLRQNLAEFVEGGGGLMGVHAATTSFTVWPGAIEDWPKFGEMLGARGASHRINDEEVVVKLDDPDHPVVRAFGGKSFTYRDEFFRVKEPYSREHVHVLLSFDTERTDMEQGQAYGPCVREDGDYPVAWVRRHGEGRVFYCTIAHNPYVFWDATMLEFYLAATQFVLGDLPGKR
jgi:type 1 glutamine amidotransferase